MTLSSVKLEIAMPIAVLSALIVGAVLASNQPAKKQKPVEHAPPPPVEMEEEEILTEVAAESEPMVIEPVSIPAPPKAPRREKVEELGTSKLELAVPEGATVWLGKKKLGTAPLEKVEILEGRYLLRVDMDDSSFSEWIDVPPGATFTYRLSLSEDAPAGEELAPGSK